MFCEKTTAWATTEYVQHSSLHNFYKTFYIFVIVGEQNDFYYLNQGNSPVIDGVSDLESFNETLNALDLLGFSKTEQNNMFQILAAVLHLGNIEFVDTIISTEHEQDQEGCGIPVSFFFVYIDI